VDRRGSRQECPIDDLKGARHDLQDLASQIIVSMIERVGPGGDWRNSGGWEHNTFAPRQRGLADAARGSQVKRIKDEPDPVG
jgi:hypothetical protein